MATDLSKISRLLEASLDPRQNKQAELALRQEEEQSNYSIALLRIVADQSVNNTIRLASALCFKNFVKRIWVDEDGNHKLPEEEVGAIKREIVGLMITVPPNIQSQLGDAVSVIADSDFWRDWDFLVEDLVSRLSSDNIKTNNGVLQVAHSIFKRWRPLFRSDELFTEILHVLERFTKPYLQLLQQTDQAIDQCDGDPSRMKELLGTLNLLIKLMYDLSCQDLPQDFEDNLESISNFLQKYLTFSSTQLIKGNEEETGPLEFVRSGIFELLSLWTMKYEEDFGKYISAFVGTTWNLLTTIGAETRYDVVVSRGLQFLTSITKVPEHAKSFDDDVTLRQVIEKVVLPNVALRDVDLEMFEDEPIEFIRRDLEGSDSDTRRRAATDFLRGLLAPFEQRVTAAVNLYISHFLSEFSSDNSANWRAKDTAVYLFSSIAARGAVTARDGVKTLNPLVNVLKFLEENVASDLLSQETPHPLLKVDAIKFLYIFRSQINREQWKDVIPPLIQQLASSNYVTHTYAAIALERALALRNEDGIPAIDKDIITPLSQALIQHLFNLIEADSALDPSLSSTKIQENEFLVRCIMRVLLVIQEGTSKLEDTLLPKIVGITDIISINPSNPKFCYYHFECIGAMIRYGDKNNIAKLENALYQPFASILERDVQDFVPYVLQLFAALLEANPNARLLDSYRPLTSIVLRVDFWFVKGYIPALVRLLTSMIMRAPDEFKDQVESVLGIFKRLLDSRMNEAHAFELLECVLTNFPNNVMGNYYVPIIQMILTKLQDTKSEAFINRFVRLYHFIAARDEEGLGADFFIRILDKIQEGLIVQVYMGVVIPNTSKLTRPMDRKIAVISLTKTLANSEAFADKYKKGWTTSCNALLELLINPPVISQGDEMTVENDVEDAAFGVGFTQLVTIKRSQHDYWPEVRNVKTWVGEYLRKQDGQYGGRIASFVQERLPDQSKLALLAIMQESSS